MDKEWVTALRILRGEFVQMGGKGSGHHRHKGRKGQRGGSAPSKGGAAPWLGGTKTIGDIRQILGREPTMEDVKRWSEERTKPPPPGYVAPEVTKPVVPPIATPKRETPTVTRPEDLDITAIKPHSKLSHFQIRHLHGQIEEKRTKAIEAAAKMDAAKSVGTVKKWHKRRKGLEQDMHYLIAVLEGRT